MIAFSSRAHDERNASILGAALGISFTVCFATGLFSHLAQDPPRWFILPASPAGLYRVTQGMHVATGIASIPLLLAKLWTVYPKLFRRPLFEGISDAVERVSLVPLIGGSLLLLFTGIANINGWYPFPFNFPIAHFWTAWITIGALIVHIGAKWAVARRALRRAPAADRSRPDPDRRAFLATAFGAAAAATLFTVGQTVRPLQRLALLAPRRPDIGPQGFPVNRTADAAGVTAAALSSAYRLRVVGNVARPLELSLANLRAMRHGDASLPIACVDGWSTSQRWTGVRVRDLLDSAGASPHARVTVESLQPRRSYRTSELNHWQAHDPDTLLALAVNGEPLHLDHGFPIRLIGPDRPGVMQTKWVTRLVVR